MSELGRLPWGEWRRQALAVFRLEIKKNFLGRRALLLYVLLVLPLLPLGLWTLVSLFEELPGEVKEFGAAQMFATAVFELAIVRFLLYIGSVWIFMNLFRGEMLDRSLHYYFLAPIRREVLLVAKFISGWFAGSVLFGLLTVVCFLMVQVSFGLTEAQRYLLEGPGLGHLLSYLGITTLACFGYGAVFLLFGLYFRNPVVPAVVIWGWEALNPILPAALKKLSVIHYRMSLRPVEPAAGPFAILANPTSPWLAVPGLLIVSALLLAVASTRVRRLEIHYTSD